MIESTLRLFTATRSGNFHYIILLSGDTLPLYRPNEIRASLEKAYAEGREFMHTTASITLEEVGWIRQRRFFADKSTLMRRIKRIFMKCFMRQDNPYFNRMPPLTRGQPMDRRYGSPPRPHLRLPRDAPRLLQGIPLQPLRRREFLPDAARRHALRRAQHKSFARPYRLVPGRSASENVYHGRPAPDGHIMFVTKRGGHGAAFRPQDRRQVGYRPLPGDRARRKVRSAPQLETAVKQHEIWQKKR